MKIVTKPWGREEWLELNDRYCYKRIYINAGYKTSYQYHNFKRETNYIISGEAEIWLENDEGVVEKKIMRSGEYFNVSPPKKHRVIALTDIILQEVSTPEVDDVIRIEDDTQRLDGKIENEHKTPAVLIVAAGLGNRLGDLTKSINKALLPIANKAIISHIIDKFPKEYDFVVAVGYKGEAVREYCQLSHPNHKFTFVEIDNIDGIGSGPGYSALQCKEHLQRPFYITTCDCLITSELPYLAGNWLGVYPTSYPEKYSTVKVDKDKNVIQFTNKNINGFDLAFVGLAGISDYETFWAILENNGSDGELVSAFMQPYGYLPNMKVKEVKWLDTGNLDDLSVAKAHFQDKPLSLQKDSNEITYKDGNRFIKFCPDFNILRNRIERAHFLKNLIPKGITHTDNFISYNWEAGTTLYELNSYELYTKFLDRLHKIITKESTYQHADFEYLKYFYIDKTDSRIKLFVDKYGDRYMKDSHNICGTVYESMDLLLSKIDYSVLSKTYFYSLFHGDLQFDNIIYDVKTDKFTYIDWRESFAGNTDAGDVYYDLAKLYGGTIFAYNEMKDETNIHFVEGSYVIEYQYNPRLVEFRNFYEKWIVDNGFDLDRVKLITALIYINMSPLHDEKFGKMLWFKAIEMLTQYIDGNK